MSSYGSVVFCRYDVFERSAFSRMKRFHPEPQLLPLPKVPMLAAEIGRRSEYTHRLPPPMKSRSA